jgi:hypothetical protein
MKNSLGLPLQGSSSSSFFLAGAACVPALSPPRVGNSALATYLLLGTKPPELGLNEEAPTLRPARLPKLNAANCPVGGAPAACIGGKPAGGT